MFGRDILNIFKCSITYMAITSFKSGKLRLKFILFIFFFRAVNQTFLSSFQFLIKLFVFDSSNVYQRGSVT